MKKKNNDLKEILQQKTEEIESLQRNYDNISVFLENEKKNSEEKDRLISELEKKINEFKEKISQIGTKDIGLFLLNLLFF